MFSDPYGTKLKVNTNEIVKETLNIWQQITHF